MDTASKILTVGGVLNLALAFVLGFVMSRIRLNGGLPPATFRWHIESPGGKASCSSG